MQNAWHRWMNITKKVVDIQANILLGVIYFALILPISFIRKANIINNKITKKQSYWVRKYAGKQDITWAKKQ